MKLKHEIPEDREHIVQINRREKEALDTWLKSPNGSHRVGRVNFEAVEDGGLLIRTSPFRYTEH